MKQGKRLLDVYKQIGKHSTLPLNEAVLAVKDHTKNTFDQTISLAVDLGLDTKKADQQLRGMVTLPHGTGKSVKIAVIVKEDKLEDAKKTGADVVGSEDIIEKIRAGFLDFDWLVATPDMMQKVSQLGPILGPKGLMPNPKLGTITTDISGIVQKLKSGSAEYRTDKQGGIRVPIGRISFHANHLENNIKFMMDILVNNKPKTAKGVYIKSVAIASTQGPGVTIDISSIHKG